MARTSVVAPLPESTAGATILPGVPLPMWGRAEEPVLPDPPPPPAPAPVDDVVTVAPPVAAGPDTAAFEAPAGLPEHLTEPVAAPAEPPIEPPVEEPVASPAAIMAEVTPDPEPSAQPLSPDDELAEALAAPVPALDPPAPAAPVAAAYAAVGAAPPTAPWGTPPAPAAAPAPLAPAPLAPAPLAPAPLAPAPLAPAPLAPAPLAPAPLHLAPPSGAPVGTGIAPELASEPEGVIADGAEPEPGRDRPGGRASRRSASSRRPLVLLGAVGGVIVLGAVAAFGWPGFLVAQDDAATTPVAQPQSPVGPTVTLQAPQTVAGLSLLPGAAAGALAKAAAGTTITGYTAPVSAVYGRGTTPVATVIAWTATSRGRTTDVATAFVGYQSATGTPVTAVTAVPPGTLGGRMSCGSTVVSATPAAVCFWSDDATFGAITVLRPPSAAQAAATATAIRSAVEKRG